MHSIMSSRSEKMHKHTKNANGGLIFNPKGAGGTSNRRGQHLPIPLSYEKQCFIAMIQNFENQRRTKRPASKNNNNKPASSPSAMVTKTDQDQLDMLISSTYQLNLRRPRKVRTRLEDKLEKNRTRWRKPPDQTNPPALKPNPGLRRSCSADATRRSRPALPVPVATSRPRISCDVSNLSLEVVGRRPCSNGEAAGSAGSRTTTPEQYSSSASSSASKIPLKSCLKSPQFEVKDELNSASRSRQILKELQRQLKTRSARTETGVEYKKRSPYVVLRQKSLSEMHDMVLELDNNLSFGNEATRTSRSTSSLSIQKEETCLFTNDSPLNTIKVNPDKINLDEAELIGRGTFSRVFKSQLFGMDVAIKVFNPTPDKTDKEALVRRCKMEGELMLQLRHPHIVQLVGACQIQDDKGGLPMLAFEYLESGSLSHYIHDVTKSPLDHGSFFSIARDLALALNYLHNQTNPIVHLDVKSANVLLDAYLRAKLADLGLAKVLRQGKEQQNDFDTGSLDLQLSGPRGTPAWMSPEVMAGNRVSTFTDVYGLGLILWEMTSATKPFEGYTMTEVYEAVGQGQRPEIPEEISSDVKSLIRQCWSQDPTLRPSCKAILDILNKLSFPDHWKALLGVNSSALSQLSSSAGDQDSSESDEEDTPETVIDHKEIEDQELSPRPPVVIKRSFSAPIPIPPPPPPPPPPISNKVADVKQDTMTVEAAPRPSFSVTSNEIQDQLSKLKSRSKPEVEEDAKMTNNVNKKEDLTSILKRVLDQRRESGWCDYSSSNASSGRGSRCSLSASKNGGNLSTVSWSGDDL